MDPNSTAQLEATFSGLFLDIMRQSKSPEQTRREADYVEMLLDLTPPGQVLDVPCGGGRIALEMAARGYRVTGIDIAQPSLDYARQQAAEHHLSDRFSAEYRDMRDLPWTAEFDAACCLWESFGYFDDAGNLDFLRAVAQALKPGGGLILDTHVTETLLPRMAARDWETLGEDTLALEERHYDHEAGTVTRHWVFVHQGRREERTLTSRLYSYRELVALLHAAGFSKCQGYTWLSIVPFALGAPRLVMTAFKG
jgi:SAM-dependent methyltransferase